ncbi:MAG: hypothetical protein ACREVM_00165, partial [Burkholderiales bacterium]
MQYGTGNSESGALGNQDFTGKFPVGFIAYLASAIALLLSFTSAHAQQPTASPEAAQRERRYT